MSLETVDAPREVTPGIWRITLPILWPPGTVHAFLIRLSGGWALLDGGLKSTPSLDALEAGIRHVGVAWKDISTLLISHMHPDHFGAAGELRRRTGAPIRMHPTEARLVAPREESQLFFAETEAYLQRHGVPEDTIAVMRKGAHSVSSTMERLTTDQELQDGDVIEYSEGELRVVLTPGHSPALLSFYLPRQRLLLSTDHMIKTITPNVGVHAFYDGDPLGDYHRSLARVAELEVDWVVPSHGNPFQNHREWITGALGHHARRFEKILDVMQAETVSGWQVAGRVWGEDRHPLDRRFAMAEGLSHLERMSRDGRVEKLQRDSAVEWVRV